MNELYHFGIPRRSGRYPWGSGDRPFQSSGGKATKKNKRKSEREQRSAQKEHQKQLQLQKRKQELYYGLDLKQKLSSYSQEEIDYFLDKMGEMMANSYNPKYWAKNYVKNFKYLLKVRRDIIGKK